MKTNHLSAWEQEEYVIDRPTPEMLRHLSECEDCRSAVGQLEQDLALFREAAVQWSARSLAQRPPVAPPRLAVAHAGMALRWAIAAALPILLLLLALLPMRIEKPRPARPPAQISDDALLDQVDEQLSVAVPSSMESLTHLVSTQGSRAAAGSGHGGKVLADTN